MKLILPKSIKESQRVIQWAFPLLIGYSVVSIPFAASHAATVALCVGVFVVFTGWSSFGTIAEDVYNDALLTSDLSLLALDFLLVHYARMLNNDAPVFYVTVWNLSGCTFLLYSLWDVIALAGRDTAAFATALHLRRFAFICFIVGLAFFSLGWGSAMVSDDHTGGYTYARVQMLCRIAGLAMWLGVLVWWHIGRVIAAVRDAA